MWISLFMVNSFLISASTAYNFGGFLVGIRDNRKQIYIQALANGASHLWTGGNDRWREGSWYWDEGDVIYHTNWDKGEPNNDDSEDCLELRSEHSWTWNDESCGQNRPFICELHACHLPEHCVTTTCTNTYDYQCTKCQDQGSTVEHSLYWPNADRKVCEATCSWKENWCWPGTCVGHLAKNCVCSVDFYKSSSNPARCELLKKPHIETCRIGAESDRGEVGNSTSHGECQNEESTYINFQPKSMSFKLITAFETPKVCQRNRHTSRNIILV
uniref:C-type lectin domain-containing protein n=1 Tax=Magallana gigas TaxID=29159 RepID=A0A8W8KS87_MAGGI